MSRHLLGLLLFVLLTCGFQAAFAAAYEVNGIKISMRADNAVKARDAAILKAQRIGLATLLGTGPAGLGGAGDAQIARMTRGFSVQNERVTGRAYSATFTIRFNSGAVQNFAAGKGINVIPQAGQGAVTATAGSTDQDKSVVAATTPDPTAAATTNEAIPIAVEAPTAIKPILVLPILDIGPRRTLWDEPNPWRDTWQQGQHDLAGTPLIVPQGDISDVADVPDANFLNGGAANLGNLISRYNAEKLYVIVAKNQSDGMLLTAYTHDGSSLQLLKKAVMHPRPGFLFIDAVPAGIRLLSGQEQPAVPVSASIARPVAATPVTTAVGNSIAVTIPYQSLQQWVSIQKRLRQVAGVRSVLPTGMSPSSARVRINVSAANFEELQTGMAQQGFNLQRLPNGEIALTDK